jgi:hypothetical protein
LVFQKEKSAHSFRGVALSGYSQQRSDARFNMDIDRRSLLGAAAIIATAGPARAQAALEAIPL